MTKTLGDDFIQKKYRIESARKDGYDYSLAGAYFITFCTKNKEHFFGEIVNAEMQYSEIGIKANEYWNEISAHFNNVVVGEFIVMPNHIHGVLILEKKDEDGGRDVIFNISNEPIEGAVNYNGSTEGNFLKNDQMANISPVIGSVSVIMRTYKSAVTKYASNCNIPFQWQSRFHDRIIRNREEYERICNYIINNPKNWQKDEFYS